MNKKRLKNIIMSIVFVGIIWLATSSVNAASISIQPSASSANPGQSVTLTISSDCTGKVNLSASNGTLSTSSVWVEGNVSATVTVGSSGSTTVTATPQTMSDVTGKDVQVPATSTSISINSSSSGQTGNNPNSGNGNNSGGTTGGETTGSNNPETPSNPTTNDQTPTNPTTTPTPQKSSNANLSNLGIRPNDFSGFRQGTTTYNVTVPNDVESVEVYATKADSKATVTGTGTKTLQEGANTLTVTVTAEDGTKKTYTINVTRETAIENEDENVTDENTTDENMISEETTQEATGDGLAELTISNVNLTPSFETGVYEYTAKYIGESTELEMEATPTDETYIVDITGNEDLQEGENIITILVSDAEGNNVATYQITVNKSLVDEEAIAREQEEKENQQRMIIIGVVIAVVVILIIIFIIIRHRKNKQWAEEYSGVPFAGLNSEDEDTEEFDNEEYEEQDEYSNQPYFQDDYADKENIEEDDDEWPKKKHGRGKRFK